jgi:hypothetical protein
MTVWPPLAVGVVAQLHDHGLVPVASWYCPPSTATSTLATPVLSDALPLTLAVPETVVPGAGLEMTMVGAVVSATVFDTVVKTLEVLLFPDLSVARAFRVWLPLL